MEIPDRPLMHVVASFECPECNATMVRDRKNDATTYYCCSPNCERLGVHYYAPTIQMTRVGAVEHW